MRSSFRWVQGLWGREEHVCSASQLLTCLPCWQVLIGDEPEQGMDNLLEVQVPEDVERQLQRLDQQEQEQHSRKHPEELAPEPQAQGAAPT